MFLNIYQTHTQTGKEIASGQTKGKTERPYYSDMLADADTKAYD